MSEKIIISFKPKDVSKKLLSVLPKRSQDVIVNRYGLGTRPTKLTLDAIGKKYGITRERVRQVEAKAIRKLQHPVRSRKLEGFMDHHGHL